ncbi:MAG: hypothetical protein KME64_39425 [Scytonematopsis contorta HA4267-MV1]|jgi:hypothetical protein|nr:hypothetical protein [Scytonematopsis contorta HA4267-MV1]
MKKQRPQLESLASSILAALVLITTAPVVANTPNFGSFKLSPGFTPEKAVFTGFTGGSYSLSAISNRDRNRKACIGFADPKPDHIMVLEKDFAQMRIQVNTGGKDTTILVQGPDDDTIRCGDDTGKNKDASVEDKRWKAGTYKIWVGTFNPGVKQNYSLSVQQGK